MTSARKRYTNTLNARKCTGPRTAMGKARSAQNARKHGFSLPVLADPELAPGVEAFARKIVSFYFGQESDPASGAHACRYAVAQHDIHRVRLAK